MQATGIEKAILSAGSQLGLARQLGVSQQVISLWRRQGWVPLKRVNEIEAQFGIPRIELVNPTILDMVSTDFL